MSDREQDLPTGAEEIAPTTDAKPNVAAAAADDDRFECRACGYTYNPNKGDPKNKIIAGTPFSAVPANWKCPACGAKKTAFINIGASGTAGFKENYKYGFGVNSMDGDQKNLLIFGAMGVAIIIFLSLYTLN